MLTVACVVALAFLGIAEGAETLRVKSEFDGHLLTQDVTEDKATNTMLIVVGDHKDFKDFKPSVNLHDFDAGYTAMKNVDDGVCLLKPLDPRKHDHETGPEHYKVQNGEKFLIETTKMYWNKDPNPLDEDEVREQAGDRLADFCHDYKVYNLVRKTNNAKYPVDRELYERNENRYSKRAAFACWGCSHLVDGYEEDEVDYMGYKYQ